MKTPQQWQLQKMNATDWWRQRNEDGKGATAAEDGKGATAAAAAGDVCMEHQRLHGTAEATAWRWHMRDGQPQHDVQTVSPLQQAQLVSKHCMSMSLALCFGMGASLN
jgi:hypothetical protein